MIAERMPAGGEQQALYKAVLDAAGDKPVTFRTLDIGGDKVLPYMQQVEEENPALGWRAIRIGLDRPGLLRAQIRALLKAAAGRELRIMFPMVATCDEFDRAKAIVEREKALSRAATATRCRAIVKLGAMIEVPSLLFQLDEIAGAADFLSVGSNDLMQFLFAADRENRARGRPLRSAERRRRCGRLQLDRRAGGRGRAARSRSAARSAASRSRPWR